MLAWFLHQKMALSKQYKSGQLNLGGEKESVEDDPRFGRSVTATTEENIDRLLLIDDKQLTINQIPMLLVYLVSELRIFCTMNLA